MGSHTYKDMVLALIEENAVSNKPSDLAKSLGHDKNYFSPSQRFKRGEKAYKDVWNALIENEEIPEAALLFIYEIILKYRKMEGFHLKPYEFSNDVDIINCRIELLQEFISGNKKNRKSIIQKYGFSNEEISFLICQSRENIIGLHALYSYKYYCNIKEAEKPNISVYFYSRVKPCFPQLPFHFKMDEMEEIDTLAIYILIEIVHVAFIEILFEKTDLSIESTFQFNDDIIDYISQKYKVLDCLKDGLLELFNVNNDLQNNVPLDIELGNKNQPKTLCLFCKLGNFLTLMTFQNKKGDLSVNFYWIIKFEDEICFISSLDREEYTYKEITCTNDIVQLKPIKKIPGLSEELYPIKKEEMTEEMFQLMKQYVSIQKDLDNLSVLSLKKTPNKNLILYIYDKKQGITYKYEKKWEDKIPAVVDYMNEDDEIFILYVNEKLVNWPQLIYQLPLSEFTLVENEHSTIETIIEKEDVNLLVSTNGCDRYIKKWFRISKVDYPVLYTIEPDDSVRIKEIDGRHYFYWEQRCIIIPFDRLDYKSEINF